MDLPKTPLGGLEWNCSKDYQIARHPFWTGEFNDQVSKYSGGFDMINRDFGYDIKNQEW